MVKTKRLPGFLKKIVGLIGNTLSNIIIDLEMELEKVS